MDYAGGTTFAREGATDLVPFSKRTLRTMLAALGLSVAVVAVPAVASASIALGTVVSDDPANFTPNVASGAVHKFVQVGGTMYAGGAFSSVSTPAGVSPGGTFARSNIVAFNASTGVIRLVRAQRQRRGLGAGQRRRLAVDRRDLHIRQRARPGAAWPS